MYSVNQPIPTDSHSNPTFFLKSSHKNDINTMDSANYHLISQHDPSTIILQPNLGPYNNMQAGYDRSNNVGTPSQEATQFKNEVSFYPHSNEEYGYNRLAPVHVQEDYIMNSYGDKSLMYHENKGYSFPSVYNNLNTGNSNGNITMGDMCPPNNSQGGTHIKQEDSKDLEIKCENKQDMVPFSLPPMNYQRYIPNEISMIDSIYQNTESGIPISNPTQSYSSSQVSQSHTSFNGYQMDLNMISQPINNHHYPLLYTGVNHALQNSHLIGNDNLNDGNLDETQRRQRYQLDQVLPMVISGPRPYSPSSGSSGNNSSVVPTKSGYLNYSTQHTRMINMGNGNVDMDIDFNQNVRHMNMNNMGNRLGPLCSTQPLRIPSHLLLTLEQRLCLEKVQVVKRVFDVEDQELSTQFLMQFELTFEQLSHPLNKWKTRNTRRRKNAVTHLYQCCCGSDVKQFHGTKGTRRSKQKFPFVACLAFAEVARRSADGALLWVRGLLDHSEECTNSKPFNSQ